MNDGILAELFRGCEEQYEMTNTKYSDNNVKDKIWNCLGEQLKK